MRGGQSDHLYWFTPSVSAPVRVKDIYSELIIIKVPGTAPMFRKALWKTGCPPRMIFFAWLLFNNRNLTWENLRKRCWHGPSWCSMCESDEETNLHMFFQCISTQEIWYELAFFIWFSSRCLWFCACSLSMVDFTMWNIRPLFIIMIWFVWKWRNHKIFNDSRVPFKSILPCICSYYDYITGNRV